LAEYAGYYFSPDVAADAVRLFHLLEKTHPREGWKVENLHEADEVWALVQAIDRRLPPWARTSWRWRILALRAGIDHVLKNNRDVSSAEAQAALKPLCAELNRIYHVQPTTEPEVQPPALAQ
jgi:acyl-CoA reductase-like NAD-dependent aldehyde dehydrogenase